MDVLIFPKDLFLLNIIRDVHLCRGSASSTTWTVTNAGHFISVVYSVAPLQQRPPVQQEKVEFIDLTLADIDSKECVR